MGVTVDTSDVVGRCEHIEDVLRGRRQRMIASKLNIMLQKDMARAFREKRAPGSTRSWAPRKNDKQGHPLLNKSGRLIQAVETRNIVRGTTVKFRGVVQAAAAKYGGVHFFGSSGARSSGGKSYGSGRYIPRRRFYGPSRQTRKDLSKYIRAILHRKRSR